MTSAKMRMMMQRRATADAWNATNGIAAVAAVVVGAFALLSVQRHTCSNRFVGELHTQERKHLASLIASKSN
jgi:hypothetical protein